MLRKSLFPILILAVTWLLEFVSPPAMAAASSGKISKIQIAADGRSFVTAENQPFHPMGVTYYRPGTGWAPQVWKQFDADATRRDFARMRELGMNCVRVFLSYGSFYMEPGRLDPDGLAKFDQFLAIAEEAGIHVYPTGPDHWEGTPRWARDDRVADEQALAALEEFWRLFATRYRGRHVIFAYDLRNEPEVSWYNGIMRVKWRKWVEQTHGTTEKLRAAWKTDSVDLDNLPTPIPVDARKDPMLLDYQRFREEVADEWTSRQVAAIKSADPNSLVSVGLIQWSVPTALPRLQHYSGFRPDRQARFVDFMDIHFYPLENGAYEYRGEEEEMRNLAYLESVVREVARCGKPVIIGEFGWYGGGKPTFDDGRHPAATGEQQARWCRRLIETTQGLAVGWLNWGLHDQPEAKDVSQLTGLLAADGQTKAWGREFQRLATSFRREPIAPRTVGSRPALFWEDCLTSMEAVNAFRNEYIKAFAAEAKAGP